ncbi:hypothetical protein WJX72_010166 [[Myrmecia] bisecta]|uniref:Secreted protein n=1 Tax=[Myrmecia] bisecta TaxID=41462 RepID=A0AAW1PX52_9CHLO
MYGCWCTEDRRSFARLPAACVTAAMSLLVSTSRAADPSATEARGTAEASRQEAAAAWALVVLAFENTTNGAATRDAASLPR